MVSANTGGSLAGHSGGARGHALVDGEPGLVYHMGALLAERGLDPLCRDEDYGTPRGEGYRAYESTYETMHD